MYRINTFLFLLLIESVVHSFVCAEKVKSALHLITPYAHLIKFLFIPFTKTRNQVIPFNQVEYEFNIYISLS